MDRVAPDADAGALTETVAGGLKYGLVSQRPGTRNDADVARQVNVPGHDADLAGARSDDARAVRADQPGSRARQDGLDTQHVEHGNAFGDTDDEPDTGRRGFQDCIGRESRRHVDHTGVRAGRAHGIAHGIENRESQVHLAAFAGRHPAEQAGTVGECLRGMEGPLRSGKTLADHPGGFVDQDAHRSIHPRHRGCAAATTFSAASVRSAAV